jgi:hypothetical protein
MIPMAEESYSSQVFAETPCERRAIKLFRKHYEAARSKPAVASLYALAVIEKRDGTHFIQKNSVIPQHDRCYVFDLNTLKLLSRAILDLAQRINEGQIIGVWQDFQYYQEENGAFKALSKTFDSIRIWGQGSPPKQAIKTDFCITHDPRILRYWITLFRSGGCRAALIARQINKAQNPQKKRFVGFYTFNPYMVKWIRWRFNLCCCGIGKLFDEWEKELHLPKIKASELSSIESATAIDQRKPVKSPSTCK